jgi:spore coat polysaccharide biosynthesis protein SpsF
VLLQVRLHSHRLPHKALLPLQGEAVLTHVLRALKPIHAEVFALLTEPGSLAALEPLAQEEGFSVFIGPEEDVLARYARAVESYQVKRIIRATGDNPLVSARAAEALLAIHERERFDLSHFLGNPLGTGVEVVEAGALLEAQARARDPYEREHITTYLYRHPRKFRVGEIPCPEEWAFPQARLTLDTEEDYALIRELFTDLYTRRPIEIEEVVEWLRRHTIPAADPQRG